MAKKTAPERERSKVRILFVDGDFAPGDLHELAQALSNAVRPGSGRRSITVQSLQALDEPGDETEDSQSDTNEEAPPTNDSGSVKMKSPAKPRNYRKPQPVSLDMKAGGTPFSNFASTKAPNAHRAKYLVAAAWLHDFAKLDAITADHIYTCYKSAGWTFDIGDPTVTFRTLKAEGLGALSRGTFKINHLGLAEVEKMKPAS